MKVETGVMVMKDGKAWGIIYEDGKCTIYGWGDPEDAPIHNPEFCKYPTDVTHKSSRYAKELLTAELVHVERRTEVTSRGITRGKLCRLLSWMCRTGKV